MGTGISCTVFADGQRLDDGCTEVGPQDPVVLTGLEITWGRSTTVDQPEASTCSFEILDPPRGGSFVDRLRTGTRIDVTASGMAYPDPTEPVWPDPGFETALPGTFRSNAVVSRSTRRASSGTYALRLDPVDAARRSTVNIAPAPFSPAGTAPDAWDEIPATLPGQTWSFGATLFAPPGATVIVRPVLYTGPYAGAGTVLPSPTLAITGDGTWQTVSGTFVPNRAGAWVGVSVSTYPTGLTWDQMPPDLTWDDLAAGAGDVRTNLPGEPNASTSTATAVGSWIGWQWDDFGAVFVDDVTVLAPAEGTASTVLVYSGRVASLEAGWDDEAGAPIISVECVDFTADLENVNVGEEPWQVEPMGTRFQRIVTATGMPVTAEIDATVADILVSWRDVDSQAAAGLLAELAESVDAVMWSATHAVTGPYLRVEDPTNRQSQFWLQYTGGVVTIVPNPGGVTAMDLSACDLLRDDVAWKQDTQDVVTRASVSWQEQGTDGDGKTTTTEKTVTEIDRPLELEHGVRGLSLSTQLQAEADATGVAQKLLARTSVSDWRASGLILDDAWLDDPDDEDVTRLLTLLDGTSRNGLPVSLTGLPTWSPTGDTVPVYLEGGKYTFEDGAWVLDLTVSNATAQGASAAWDELDTSWTWDMFDPAITWDDLRGVGVAPEGA